jgi:alpha-galactosidase
LNLGFASLLLILPVAGIAPAQAAAGGLARTPPMAWISDGCGVSEVSLRGVAAALVGTGLRAVGYQTVILGSCWQQGRDIDGRPAPDPGRFPSGIEALAATVHRRGLGFGLAAANDCAEPAQAEADAKTYASWGVDTLIIQGCGGAPQQVTPLVEALRATGRPIVIRVANPAGLTPWLWAPALANVWPGAGLFAGCFDCTSVGAAGRLAGGGVVQALDHASGLARYAGPGGWNDPGPLAAGQRDLSAVEQQTQLSLWAMLAAPLTIAADVTHLDPQTLALLTSKAVIAIDQDPAGREAERISLDGPAEVWSRGLADGGRAVVLLNRGATRQFIAVQWAALGLPDRPTVRDVWRGTTLNSLRGGYAALVAPHAAILLRITPAE